VTALAWLVPAALALGGLGLAAFLWALRAGQFVREAMKSVIASGNVAPADLIAISIEDILSRMSVAAVVIV
jgi:cbb3-type cytochrome oxidase maturation protein